jgi:hypothetical protein
MPLANFLVLKVNFNRFPGGCFVIGARLKHASQNRIFTSLI